MAATPVRAEPGQAYIGRVVVIDGDTVEMRGERIRLWGIDAPESAQLCFDAQARPHRCGQAAANRLAEMIGAQLVTCVQVDTDRYGRPVAVCSIGSVDLGHAMIRKGHAIDYRQYSKGQYANAENAARKAAVGIWQMRFADPAKYRQCERSGGLPSTCSRPVRAPRGR